MIPTALAHPSRAGSPGSAVRSPPDTPKGTRRRQAAGSWWPDPDCERAGASRTHASQFRCRTHPAPARSRGRGTVRAKPGTDSHAPIAGTGRAGWFRASPGGRGRLRNPEPGRPGSRQGRTSRLPHPGSRLPPTLQTSPDAAAAGSSPAGPARPECRPAGRRTSPAAGGALGNPLRRRSARRG